MLERMRRKGNLSALLVEMQTGEATVEYCVEFPQKTKNGLLFFGGSLVGSIYVGLAFLSIQLFYVF